MSYYEFYSQYIKKISLPSFDGECVGLCPFHNDTTASFGVNIDSGLWICYAGCGAGNILTFSKQLDTAPAFFSLHSKTNSHYNRRAAKNKIEITGPLPKFWLNKAVKFHSDLIKDFKNIIKGLPWNIKAVDAFKVGYDKEKDCITYLYSSANKLPLNIKWGKPFNGHKPPHGIKGYSQTRFYGEHLTNSYSNEYIIICEGEKDAITLASSGYQVFSVSNGAKSVPKDISILKKFKTIYIIYDNDKAGIEGAKIMAAKIKQQIENAEVVIHFWDDDLPQGYDVTDFFMNKESNDFLEILGTKGEQNVR